MASLSSLLGLRPLRRVAGWWMKWRWNQRSRANAAHAIADFTEDWSDMDTFFATGRDDVDKLLRIGGWDTRDDLSASSLLEIGCGAGRMTRHLAARFQSVTALDISGEMIRKARELNPALTNATFLEGNGTDLQPLPDHSFDAVLSYIVFQHIPSRHIVYGYIEEALRVLKPAGQFLFQARNDFAHAGTGTYAGDSVVIEDIRTLAQRHGRSLTVIEGAGTQYCYFLIHLRDAGSASAS